MSKMANQDRNEKKRLKCETMATESTFLVSFCFQQNLTEDDKLAGESILMAELVSSS